MANKYNPDIHHRRSIRLTGHDYSQSGLYFITLCAVNKICMFGNVVDGKMQLNDIGQLVEQEWLNTINIRHDDVRLHNYIVMPNHFHAIIEICECMDECDSSQILNTDNVGEYAMGECECRGESYSPDIYRDFCL